jgi:polar amino acid transport system permease protein
MVDKVLTPRKESLPRNLRRLPNAMASRPLHLDLLVRYGPRLLDGLAVTIELVVLSVLAGSLLALARLSPSRIVGALAFAYSYFFRGTPLLAQTFLVYYGAGQFRLALEDAGLWWLFREAFYCALLTFTLNTAAYQAEIYRGAIRSLPRGQWEAAAPLGLPRRIALLRIVAPHAAIVALRPLGNELIR